MRISRRIAEVVALLEAYALGEIDLPRERLAAALALLDLGISDAVPPDDGDALPALGDDQAMPAYRLKLVS
jgi:hypothetical protein